MKKIITLMFSLAFILGMLSLNAQNTITYTDDFSTNLDYMTQAIPEGNIWEAWEVNAGTNATQNTVLTKLAAESGGLVIESEDGNFEGAALDDGVFLYRTVPDGIDFEAQVKITGGDFTSFTGVELYHNSAGILVRLADYTTADDFVYAMMFELWGIHHMIKSIDDAVQTEIFADVSTLTQFPSISEYPWIKLTRVGDLFTTSTSTDGVTWFETNSVERADMGGMDLRVGLTHCNFTIVDETDPTVVSNVPGTAQAILDDFSLTHEDLSQSTQDVNAPGFRVWSHNHKVVLQSSGNRTIESASLYSIDGRVIASRNQVMDRRCEFGNLRTGMYIAVATVDGTEKALKIVVR